MDLVRRANPEGWIDREVGRERFMAEVRARGFHLIQSGDQWVVICHSGFFRVVF